MRRYLLPVAQIAGLLATGWTVWLASFAPRLEYSTLPGLIAEAVQYALLAWCWGAAIGIGLILFAPVRDPAKLVVLALRTSYTAVWFAPATLLLSEFSPATLVAAVFLVVSATRLLYFEWRLLFPEIEWQPITRMWITGPFGLCVPPGLLRQLTPALLVSSSTQAAMLAILMGFPLLAAAFLVLSTAALTFLIMLAGTWEVERPPSLPRAAFGVLLTIVLAAGMTVAGIRIAHRQTGESRWTRRSHPKASPVAAARALLRDILYGEEARQEPKETVTALYTAAPEGREVDDGSYAGVILWPEVESHITLVAPLPVFGSYGSLELSSPLSIPFAGEYWMFKPPYVRPPLTSYFQRASPVTLSFKTRDHRPMFMQARQKLDHSLDLRCCSEMRLAVLNADRYPGTLSLELVLIATGPQGRSSLSLGRAPVTSRPNLRGDSVIPVPEVLSFLVPAQAPLREFNEFQIIFHRNLLRIDRSAKLSIDRFVLVPRHM